MRNLLVALVMLAIPPAMLGAQNPWRLLTNQTVVQKKTCISSEGVKDTAAAVTAWLRDEYVTPQQIPGGKEFTVAKAQILVDCSAAVWKMVHVIAYDSEGARVYDDVTQPTTFQSTAPGVAGSEFARAACRMADSRHRLAASNVTD